MFHEVILYGCETWCHSEGRPQIEGVTALSEIIIIHLVEQGAK
jgi:hypothetical protein